MALFRVGGLSQQERHNMTVSIIEGCLIVSAMQVVANFIAVYVLRLGGTEQHVGLIASFPFLVNALALMISSRLVAPPKKALRVAIAGAIGHRIFFALIPFAFIVGNVAPVWVIATFSLASGFMALSATYWTTAVSDMFPTKKRGRVFGIRNVFIYLTAFIATFAAGFLLDALPFPTNFTVTFSIAALVGISATFYLSKLQIPETSQTGETSIIQRLSPRDIMARTNGSTFWRVALPVIFFNTGLHGLMPIINIYFIEHLGYNNSTIGLLMSVYVLSQVPGAFVWGFLADRWGHRAVAAVAIGGMAIQAALFWIYPSVIFLVLMQVLGGFCVAGAILGTFNMTISLGSSQQRSQFVTWINVFGNAAAFVGPLVATSVLLRFGLIPAFLLVFVLRAAGVGVLTRSGKGELPADLPDVAA